MSFNKWDIALLVIIPIQATIMAYIYNPRVKGILSIIPLPFTLATLSLGRFIDSTNAAGILVLIFFVHSVRILADKLRLHITAAIILSASGYCVIGSTLVKIIPQTAAAFWLIAGLCSAAGIMLYFLSPKKVEPGYRSPLPVAVKWLVITCVILILIVIKKNLLGFLTLFPMVGVVASYELRKSLWTYCHNIHLFLVAGCPMLMAMRVTQGRIGLEAALLAGWTVLLMIAVPLYFLTFKNREET